MKEFRAIVTRTWLRIWHFFALLEISRFFVRAWQSQHVTKASCTCTTLWYSPHDDTHISVSSNTLSLDAYVIALVIQIVQL